MNSPIVVDTGGLLRALARTPEGGASFLEYEAALTSASPVIVPGLVLAEVDYERPLPSDLVRGLELDAKFKDLEMGLVDATVAAVAERRQVYRILTTDRRDFGAIRVGPRFTRSLELVP